MIEASTEAIPLQQVPYIRYPVQFQRVEVQALIDSRSEVIAMNLAYAAKLGLVTRETDVDAHEIDDSPLAPYGMVLRGFFVQD